ncbi:hypothetical protein QTP70_003869 [Hemibagrus guttatus]|uniref:Uncharacterized protein n=1 Tax=Hemibagrus guttatus TaxID=175788 RepID=A0AAE0UIA5_9TELE|nr:hypothetical protein QTP70_003869 [Hemibagrus guttatus]
MEDLRNPTVRDKILQKVGIADSALGSDKFSFTESDFRPRTHKSGYRLSVEAGAEAQGVGSPFTGGGKHLADFQPCGSGSVHHQESTHCPLWYSLSHSAPLVLDALVQMWPWLHLYAFPTVALLPDVLARVRHDGVRFLLVAPRWPA